METIKILDRALKRALFALIAWISLVGMGYAQVSCEDWASRSFVETSSPAAVEQCVSAGADLDARDNDGLTVLHHAAAVGAARIVIVLIGAGADFKARDNAGWTPLHHAASTGNPETVLALLEDAWETAGARTNDCKLPLDLVRENEKVVDTDAYYTLMVYTSVQSGF